MNIITVSREFGSGGRELAKRMADVLGWDYYDREIIDAVAREEGLNPEYVNAVLERHEWYTVPITFHRSFTTVTAPTTELLVKERQVISRIAQAGRNCILVGRNADVFLRDLDPFRIFVCAQQEAKIRRCRERAPEQENLSDRELLRQIRRIDKNRAAVRDLVAGAPWGDRTSYHLTVNTTGWDLKDLAPAIAATAQAWFQRKHHGDSTV